MTARIVFRYSRRKGDELVREARLGEIITLDERVDYVLSFASGGLSPVERRRVADLGGEAIGSNLAILSFGNFVGRTELGGVTIEVVSTKIGPGGVSRVL